MHKNYETLRKLIVIFFGPDYQIFGENIDEIMASYVDTENELAIGHLRQQASQAIAIQSDYELNSIMTALAENQFSPALWGETWRSFLQKILLHLPE
ncbi:contact-dependent growth inhibition system immunity protein [Cronobacter malonaticus]|nr:contact-dependent growth inhibition system immunity protein [Cronobacter malonaticus]MDK1256893.1 contact-dependent growth inhibition system immunity protein [Cronobacter malonaticus]MDK1321596.1 contact-dependent growth inhibition system immunity protein [Cronobacter malonaticus]